MKRLDAGAIERELSRLGAPLGRPLTVVEETASTNDDARSAAASGAPHGAAFLADAQTQGRGRGGRAWHSPPGENLYLSLVLRPRLPASSIAPIALVMGLAVASVVERRLAPTGSGGVPGDRPAAEVRLKWPNDVLAGGRKLAGILVEAQLRGDAVSSLIVGVGLNVHTRSFPPELSSRATSLALLGQGGVPRESLAAELIQAMGGAAVRFEAERLAAFAEELARMDWLRDRRVEVAGVAGVAAGIDPEGHLLVRGADGVLRAVAAGEVSVISS
ncbi:biotin--[acetyl-CoA-carboxylase] synthetase [Sorangium cellulosum]|uniref:biotin--[biotin carboxyl-carrier protein] ligase n=1 Tax=Sorangium cellulosum TaxID=56 RepID=A0A2L0EQB8_SORCE|nr:biotin--[acetyl-CoA-carboxylase] ligase [Sorangium cellulosum]AUX41507.1 biotin--[acetyl-CoA-carboxylase] synthetase [Sorangium cellulosum]